jgi:hypothetical protein
VDRRRRGGEAIMHRRKGQNAVLLFLTDAVIERERNVGRSRVG